jgi:hypothetical protein
MESTPMSVKPRKIDSVRMNSRWLVADQEAPQLAASESTTSAAPRHSGKHQCFQSIFVDDRLHKLVFADCAIAELLESLI